MPDNRAEGIIVIAFDGSAAATLTRDNLTNANAVNLSAGSRHKPQLCRLGGRRLRTAVERDSGVMRPISTEGFEKPKSVSAGAAPMLQWLKITDLVVDPAYQRPIVGKGRQNVDRIARAFAWSCFAPVVVSPVAGGKFAIIDGQHRTTAATLVGFDSVPCQIVIAAKEEQAAAFKAINGTTTPISIMALHAAALVACEPGPSRSRMSAHAPRLICCATRYLRTSRRPDKPWRSAPSPSASSGTARRR
jgi:hypothetical protein